MSKAVFEAMDAFLATPEGQRYTETMKVYREAKTVYDATLEATRPRVVIVEKRVSTRGENAP